MLAFLAVSMDSATKVLHGIAHDINEREHVRATALPHANVALQGSLDAFDPEHIDLHLSAVAVTLLKAPIVGTSVVQIPAGVTTTLANAAPDTDSEGQSPTVRDGPSQPRAPPLA